jgi:3',5'-cyclic AMP phosphodiesterase CpdA
MPKILHFSDIHVWRSTGWDGDFTLKRVLGRINLLLNRRKGYPLDLSRRVVKRVVDTPADAVLFSGDASTAGLLAEFEDLRRLCTPIAQKWGDRFVAIPGNHDRYTSRATRERLFERFFLGRDQDYPFYHTLGGEIGVLGVDLSGPRAVSARGVLSPEGLRRIRDELERRRNETACLVVLGHYPLLYPPGLSAKWSHRLPLRVDLARAVVESGARLYLHGHTHRRWALSARSDSSHPGVPVASPWTGSVEKGLVCVNSGSAGRLSADPLKAAGFLEMDVDAGGVRQITAHYLRRSESGDWEWMSLDMAAPSQSESQARL